VGTSINKIAAIAAFTTLLPTVALPQAGAGQQGGYVIDLGVSTSLTFDDNFSLVPNSPGTTKIFDNKFTFSIDKTTSSQSLNITGSTVLRYADFPGRSTSGFEEPTVRFKYTTASSNSSLTLDGRYRRVDREFLNPFAVAQDDLFDPTTSLLGGGGTLTDRSAGLVYKTGITAPLGFTLALRHDDRTYSNLGGLPPATVARLFDTDTDRADATVTMQVSPVTQLRLKAGLIQYDATDAVRTDRTTQDYSIGVVQDINPVLVLDAQIGYTDVETVTTGGTSQRTGTTGSVSLTQTLRNGSVFGSLSSTLNQNGTRTTFRFGRDLQLKTGSLSASIGATRGPNSDTQAIAALSYTRQMKSSDITVTLDRTASTNGLSEDVLDTRLGVNYGYLINSSSRFNIAVNLARSENIDNSTAPTVDRRNLRASYTRNLTRDWDLTTGVAVRYSKDSTVAAGSATSNSVFLTLDRKFSFRP
jgi:hypothetical protein